MVAVSDIHCRDVVTPDADLLIVAGDHTYNGTFEELQWFSSWLLKQPQKHKVWIAGNHDKNLELYPSLGPQIAKETNSIYLNDSICKINGIVIWGSPFIPKIGNWAFMYSRPTDRWKNIPEKCDIVVTHGPCYKILDQVLGGESVGCVDLAERIKVLKPAVHIAGHIHEAYGVLQQDGTTYINAAICDEDYLPTHKPVEFEI